MKTGIHIVLPSDRIRSRLEELRSEAVPLRRKLQAINRFHGRGLVTVEARVRSFLNSATSVAFSPAEIAEATGDSAETVRRTLRRMDDIRHDGYGAYRPKDER